MGLRLAETWVNARMELVKDTPVTAPEQTHPDDAQKTGSGSAEAIGGGDAPALTASDASHGGEGYPGPRPGGETDKLKEEPK